MNRSTTLYAVPAPHSAPSAARPARRRSALLGAVVAGLTLSVLAPAAPAAAAPGDTFTGPVSSALSQLVTATEVRTGYDRTLFPHWKDEDGDGCHARNEVLIEESVTPVTVGSGCSLSGGRWYSYYDGASWTATSDVDIDHLVALAEAWDSGARTWTTAVRQSFANDLGDSRSLVAITDNVNQSKGDQDPATWQPTLEKCRYLLEWVVVKTRWKLSVDTAERTALNNMASGCSDTTITVTYAR